MITYKFTIGKKGQLTCYKSDNTLNKYTGKKALNKLEHIKDFSFHSFENIVKEINANKKCHCMVFVSNNHMVTFEDISKFQRNATFPIEDLLRDLLVIIKDNQIKNQELEQKVKELYNIDVKKTKLALLAAFSAAVITINHYPTMVANQSEENYVRKQLKKETEVIKVTPVAEEYPEEIISTARFGFITREKDYTLINENNIVSFASDVEYDGRVLNSTDGVIENNPSGAYETYYDADVICDVGMDNCVKYMRDLGFDEDTYPYYIREDGVRMFGEYVMVAANTDILPKGTLIDTSLGMGMVVDHCENSEINVKQIDIAVNWTKNLELKK